ncbi:MAG TPA: hypothetical protein VFQ18_03620 [Candidatus Acidoferrum sp.]|nr:hypothetical protein [Candidatus Acidoferrum sp.]
MSGLTNRIIDQINASNTVEDLEGWIWKAGDLLEKVFSQNFHSGFEEIDNEEVNEADGQKIQAALLQALKRNSDARFVGTILNALTGSNDGSLKPIYVEYLAEHLSKLKESNSVVHSALLGLDNVGESVYEKNPGGGSSQSLIDVDKNIRQANKFLLNLGYKIHW